MCCLFVLVCLFVCVCVCLCAYMCEFVCVWLVFVVSDLCRGRRSVACVVGWGGSGRGGRAPRNVDDAIHFY